MKLYTFMFLSLFLLSCSEVDASSNEFYCLSDGNKSILLVSSEYPNIKFVKYYPYLTNIKISKPIKTEEVSMGDNAKPEIYRTMSEIIDGKVTGEYTFMSQGYLLYDVTYINKKNKKEISFSKETLNLKGVYCL